MHHEDGFNLDEAQGQLPRRLWMRRALLRGVRTVVVPSANLERIARRTWWLRGDRVRFVVNGVDTARFHPGEGVTSRYVGKLLSAAFDGLVTLDPHLHRHASLGAVYSVPHVTATALPPPPKPSTRAMAGGPSAWWPIWPIRPRSM